MKPPTVLHLPAVDVAVAAVRLVQQLEADLRWAHSIGYGKSTITAGPPPDGEPSSDQVDDEQPGDRFDIGHGDRACRAAYDAAVGRLADIEKATADAVATVGRRTAPPILFHPTADSTTTVVQLTLNGIRWRLLTLATDLRTVDDLTARRTKRLLLRAWSGLNAATLGLVKPLARERALEVDETRRCTVCTIRPMAMRLKKLKKDQGWRMVPAKGGRCHTCAAWYLDPKHKGTERPRDLDNIDDALDAQRRRHDRGEGWGEG